MEHNKTQQHRSSKNIIKTLRRTTTTTTPTCGMTMSTTMTTTTILDPTETFATLFETVGLDDRLRQAVARLGHSRPTLVQAKALPLAISSGRDLLVRSRTGSGKVCVLIYMYTYIGRCLSVSEDAYLCCFWLVCQKFVCLHILHVFAKDLSLCLSLSLTFIAFLVSSSTVVYPIPI
jgi:hypothetical protein